MLGTEQRNSAHKYIVSIFFTIATAVILYPGSLKAQTAPADTVIRVTMKNFSFVPNQLEIPSGERVKLEFHNKGSVTHAFMAGNVLTEELEGYENGLFEGVKVTKSVNGQTTTKTYGSGSLMLGVKPGQSASLTFRMPDAKQGTYEFGCFKTAGTGGTKHYKVGMKGQIRVGELMHAHKHE